MTKILVNAAPIRFSSLRLASCQENNPGDCVPRWEASTTTSEPKPLVSLLHTRERIRVYLIAHGPFAADALHRPKPAECESSYKPGESRREPDKYGVGAVPRRGIEHASAGQEVHSEIRADASQQQIANLGIGFITADCFVQFHKDELRDAQSQSAADLACDEFGHQSQR